MTADPFRQLGLDPGASAEEVVEARRRMAREHHPDRGGDAGRMQDINAAADAALIEIRRRPSDAGARSSEQPGPTDPTGTSDPTVDIGHPEPTRIARDVPSFTVEALPAETFEALLIAAATLGDLLDEDPPYRLDAYLRAPYDCWCRLDVVPDAGASTVSLTVAGLDERPAPSLTAVRDAWVVALNDLDWP